jgi:hypothetical protein
LFFSSNFPSIASVTTLAAIAEIRSTESHVKKKVPKKGKYSSTLNVYNEPLGILSSVELISQEEALFTALALFGTLVFYFGVFHSLANLPLGDKLLFGIHQRFWMQPNVLFFCFAGAGFNFALYGIDRAVVSLVST